MEAVICRPNPFRILGPMVTHTNHFCLHLRVGELSGVLPDSVMPDSARFSGKADHTRQPVLSGPSAPLAINASASRVSSTALCELSTGNHQQSLVFVDHYRSRCSNGAC